ncbi:MULTISPECIES: MMPL family transporter [Brevibacterium]|jgi:RND superfamily putative drug exporter|uniref:MMPL family transporter n=1 Tax=Brevibacterium casei TaxID=33889 RepID=A0A7T3ZZS8_9MICO|nr:MULTISPECIES: MMPL family transporter [Brevibacterium]QQB14658.1 MMPL family transporter [Brevibacterium casei]
MKNSLANIGTALVSKRGAWIVLGAVLVLVTLLFGLLSGAGEDRPMESAPPDSEASQVADTLAKFPEADEQTVMVVASRTDGQALSPADESGLTNLGGSLSQPDAEVSGPVTSDDGEAALLMVPITVGLTNSETADTVDALRETIAGDSGAQQLEDAGVSLLVTGGPAIGADIASAFNGADFTLLIVTVVIVALLLIITYRSPILWLLPLVVIGTADGLASTVTAALGDAFDLQFDAGIISVLVFGAGANYALLLISRYREELALVADHRVALAAAWRHTVGTILASNLTVVLSLASLVVAVIPGTRGLGITAAAGLLIAAAAVLIALPPVLAICGTRVFWPFVPTVDGSVVEGSPTSTPTEATATTVTTPTEATAADSAPATARSTASARPSLWRRIATWVVRRPGLHLGVGIAVLAIMATGLLGTTVGLDQEEKFRVQSESAQGLTVLGEHFPPGESQPIWVVADADRAADVVDSVSAIDGVVRAVPVAETTIDGEPTAKIMVTGEYAPDSTDGLDLVETIRTDVHAIAGADAEVGGAAAMEIDARAGNAEDFRTIVPLILLISAVILLGVLRAPLVALTLLVVNIASAAAAIGLGAALSRVIFGQAAVDAQVPILAFLFLVALGIDYSIFLSHRAKKESEVHGARRGIIEAVAHTGGVITSAGIVLAGVFAALGMLPLMVLGQLGLIVGVGVLVDTVLVRTIIVPAILGLAGSRIWWPNRKIARAEAVADSAAPARSGAGSVAVEEPRVEVAHGR